MNEHRSKIATAGWITRRARLDAAFWDRVDRSGGSESCWPWTGGHQARTASGTGGYGVFKRHRKLVYAHRRALEITLARELEPGEMALHRCDNPPCCNPKHLYAGSPADNMRDRVDRTPPRIALRPCPDCGRPQEVAVRRRCPECQVLATREKRARAYVAWKARGGLNELRAERRYAANR